MSTGDDSGKGARIRVVLIDDHDLFRTGLRELLEEDGIEVVAEAAGATSGVEQVVAAAPDVVVMDVNMPEQSGIEATRQVKQLSPATRVLMVSVYEEEAQIAEAIVAGASGYLLKDSAAEEICAGVRATARGEPMLSARIAARLLEHVEGDELGGLGRAALSDREVAVLRSLAAAKDHAETAAELGLSTRAVRNHVANLLAKLQAANRIEAEVSALRRAT